MSTVKEILEDLGYKLSDNGNYFRARPLYRDSKNDTSLSISKKTGRWIDFSANIGGNLKELVSLTTGEQDISKINIFLNDANFSNNDPIIQTPEYWDISILENLIKDHSYWAARGISAETMSIFKGGIATKGKMKNRYVIPILDKHNKVIGVTGRDTTNKSKSKWLHLGAKKNWIWPLVSKDFIIETKQVILVESPGDVLALWDNGIKNVICLFGVNLNDSIISFLAGISPRIIISLNRDGDLNGFVGENASKKIESKLLEFFNPDKVKICLPTKNDFGCMTKEEIAQFKVDFLG